MIYLFFICFFLITYTYILFPLFMIFLSRNKKLNRETFSKAEELPAVSILIAAYNEQDVIKEKVLSIINADFPKSKIEILIGSDCSTDSTNQIIKDLSMEYPFIRTFIFDERSGKSGVVNKLVKEAKNEIIILTDANIIFSKNTCKLDAISAYNWLLSFIFLSILTSGISKSNLNLSIKKGSFAFLLSPNSPKNLLVKFVSESILKSKYSLFSSKLGPVDLNNFSILSKYFGLP